MGKGKVRALVWCALAIVMAVMLVGCPADPGKCNRECACRTTPRSQHKCLMHCGTHGHGNCKEGER